MMNIIKKLFIKKPEKKISDYTSFSDFFLHAPDQMKKDLIAEAARGANEEQMRVFQEAQRKTKVCPE